MEIRAFAERVLFADRLADKLEPAGPLTDQAPGAAITAPSEPARPPELRFRASRARASLPRPQELADRSAAASLLHAFANHELLAMELMALFLLKCPDAPRPFRLGLARILGEEQIHLGLYLARLEHLGVAFGSLPLNRFLWDCVAPSEAVSDFTARMGLTFEAANLDHALSWGSAFRAAGDLESAAVLERVYADELGHVRHALHWFRSELTPGQDLWEAYRGRLQLPLSPERARGRALSVEARRQAGFDEDFIESLALYAHSKGRPPTVRLFNPDVEAQVAAGDPAFEPEGAALALARDLDLLPAWLAARDDVVVTRRPPRSAFLKELQAAGLTLPQIVVVPDLARLGDSELAGRKLSGIDPWGWSPASAAWVGPLASGVLGPAPAGWSVERRALYSKGLASELLADFMALYACDTRLCGPDAVGVRARDAEAVGAAVAALVASGQIALIKAPFGTAGRGARRVSGDLTDQDRAWLAAALAWGEPVVIEPWLDRALDLSFHLDVEEDGEIRYRGVTRFFTSPGGRYRGTWVGPLSHDQDPALTRFLHADGQDRRWLDRVARAVCARVGARAARLGHRGPIGVDALVYRAADGLRLKPLVEINPRTTMGRVGLALQRRVAPGSGAVFAVLSRGDLRRAGYSSFSEYAAGRPPPRYEGGRLVAGVLFTTDPEGAAAFTSALSAGPDARACWAALGLGVD